MKTLLIVFALVIIAGSCIAYTNTKETLTVKVTDKERVNSKDNSKYLIFTDSETFEDTDSILFGKWDSSDMYGQLKPGGTYQITVIGWRVPFLSSYRNILEIQKR